MNKDFRNLSAGRWRGVVPLLLLSCLSIRSEPAHAQVGPVDHSGYLEYQYRISRSEQGLGSDLHRATWRARASTFVWQPYILLVDGNLALTRTRNSTNDNKNVGTLVTGGIYSSLFARSTFPLRVYFESRDSRVDGDVFDTDFTTRNWGFMQQLASRRNGSRLALEYRRSDTDEVSINGRTELRKFGSELWQLTGNKAFGRNDFRLLTSVRKLSRDLPQQSQNRKVLNLRHRFRAGLRFNIDDRLFYSDERLNLNGSDQQRRFLQFNGFSNWRPKTSKPLLVTGRLVGQAVEAGNGMTRGSQNFVLSGNATYQYSPRFTFAASAGVNGSDNDDSESQTGSFQRVRGTFRSSPIALGTLAYNWGTALDLANHSFERDGSDSVQSLGASFNHGISRNAFLGNGRNFQVSLTQTATAIGDTEDRREQSLVNTAFVTLSRQNGRVQSYLRLSASDRRLYGDRRDEFQLVSLQGSSRMQISRQRSLNGGFSVQYSNSAMPLVMNGSQEMMMDRGSFTYSVTLTYTDRQLFDVNNLSFLTQLRYLSSEFRSDDVFDVEDTFDPRRSDSSWRNELNYRIGLLEFRLLAEIRDLNGQWVSQAFFGVRRYYGTS